MEDLVKKYAFYILGNLEHIKRTIELATMAMEIDGDLCEVGTYIGGNCAIMGELCKHYKKDKTIYLFDSFEGIPYPTEEDTVIPGEPEGIERTGELKSTGVSVATLEWVQRVLTMSGYPNFVIMKGWVQNSIKPALAILKKIAFLRIDLDLYAPTKYTLENLYDRVVKTGIVFVHDYETLPGCRQAVDEFLKLHPEITPTVDTIGGGVWWVK